MIDIKENQVMFQEGEKIYYVDTKDGIIYYARFIESTDDGVWINIDGNTINTFIYRDNIEITLYKDLNDAKTGLDKYRSNLKAKLLKEDYYLKDILIRLSKTEGKLYTDIIGEILNDLKKI